MAVNDDPPIENVNTAVLVATVRAALDNPSGRIPASRIFRARRALDELARRVRLNERRAWEFTNA